MLGGGGGLCSNCGCIILYIGGDFILCLEIMFTCRNVMGRRIAMTIYEVMCDVRQRAKRKAADWRRVGK